MVTLRSKLLLKILASMLKVCHSSAFQTSSVRSVYIKIINYSSSILANLKNTMQTKLEWGLFFVVEWSYEENDQNLELFSKYLHF